MSTVTVSPKYQVVIPKDVREALHIEPGQKLSAMVWNGHIALVPVPTLAALQDMFKGTRNDFQRQKQDRDL
ncbi:AbrB/MazE/SpoVT family DNA-binding domain-containing protein [Polymorphobacter fuscus]|uniref:AbrB/MazE/SpoVT family DNA-binding domain-containing protein n=1 Tax=Sandarakinorhabdus fusca TaxID=1439888 RepID=A0A7C9KVN0_9SPHN|nr:AbrB/MazE/SpoVT family DNA-binding domain-containing protein [Polymorphobacter fuscus]KAB7648773.1 AbrB/MazE/SpoVT family DNA-binding domain-containing protein [Polymorphobacter fuscus]MQT16345.1 AbrB/MazE/SpoVT family DNA-binding domain-containing protein [Polymorphobacter fuscus]NJC07367.1 AbrB family looped-hinge helix DNA binding protein [Polymorphobacter fuscus]